MADENTDYSNAESGASSTYPQQCSALRKNGFVVIKGHPCKIVEMSTSKTGKHGHAKVHLVGLDIFTGKKYEDICPSTHNMNVPHVKRLDYICHGMDEDGYFELMSDAGDIREDLKHTDECHQNLEDARKMIAEAEKAGSDVLATVLSAMDQEVVKELKLK